MPLTLQPCSADEEIQAQELIRPVELQGTYLDGLCWAFVLDGDERVGALMWPRDGSNMPTDIEIAPTMIEATYPNQNLYWGVQ
jgi:hypothetical protein